MILSDRDIRAALQRLENPLIVDPGFDPRRLQPASLELTLGTDILVEQQGYKYVSAGGSGRWLVSDIDWTPEVIGDDGFEMEPNEFILASTVEMIRVPTDMVAQVNGKSSWARQGLICHTMAGFIDPGFKGTVTLELKNVSRKPIRLLPGVPICQLVFTQLTSPAERPYGSTGLGSHYQNQKGVTPSAL